MSSLAAYTAIFLVSLLSFGQNVNACYSSVDQGISTEFQSASFLSIDHTSQALDFHGVITLLEANVEDSRELDEKPSLSHLSLDLADQGVQSSSRSIVSNFLASFNDCQAVSLYVLHHSWRSFIA